MDATDALVDGQAEQPHVIDLRDSSEPDRRPGLGGDALPPKRRTVAVMGLLVVLAILAAWVVGGGADPADGPDSDPDVSPQPGLGGSLDGSADGMVARRVVVPPELRAAEAYVSSPGRKTLRDLFLAVGGWDGLELGVAEGAFDLVTFDPENGDRLLASHRRGYGPAQNQTENEVWRVRSGDVLQELWDPDEAHDFVHFNSDGTTTMWRHGGGEAGFAPRQAVVLDRRGVPAASTAPLYADRFAVDAGVVFALTGYPDWYSSGDGYVALVADLGFGDERLAPGDEFGWVDIPAPGLVVAYPADPAGGIALWSTETLERLDDHPLAGRPYRRVAMSGDRRTAIAVNETGQLEAVELATGRTTVTFGRIDVEGVERPVSVNHDGTVAMTVTAAGEVSIWWVGDDVPVASVDGSGGLARWVPSTRSARVTSALAPDATRAAVQHPARPEQPVSWHIVDTDVASWVERACHAATDGLSAPDRTQVLLSVTPGLCERR